jgi:hypothetical protein
VILVCTDRAKGVTVFEEEELFESDEEENDNKSGIDSPPPPPPPLCEERSIELIGLEEREAEESCDLHLSILSFSLAFLLFEDEVDVDNVCRFPFVEEEEETRTIDEEEEGFEIVVLEEG